MISFSSSLQRPKDSSVQFSCSVMSNSLQHHGLQHTRPPFHHQLPEFTQTHVHWVGDAIQPSHPVIPFSSCPQSFPKIGSFLMNQFFASGGQSISFSFNISPPSEHPGLISFRIDWLDPLAVQRTLKSLLHQHNSKTSIFPGSAFFTVQLSHPHMTSGKIIAPTYREIL